MPLRYAYGCNELVFNPVYKWWKGPFTPLFWRFLFSNIKMTSKITILAYIGTCEYILAAFRYLRGLCTDTTSSRLCDRMRSSPRTRQLYHGWLVQ